MVTTYWSMAAALVLHGAIEDQMFADANSEHIMVYARLRPFLTELRALLNNPGYLDKVEQVILRMPDAQARLARFPGPAKGKAGTPKGPRTDERQTRRSPDPRRPQIGRPLVPTSPKCTHTRT